MAKRKLKNDSGLLVHDIPCEERVLAQIMYNNSVLDEYREQLSPSCFYKPQHEEIFNAICSLHEQGKSADIITVFEELEKRGSEITQYEVTRISGESTFVDLPLYIARLEHLAISRKLWLIAKKLENVGTMVHYDLESIIEEARAALNEVYTYNNKQYVTLGESLGKLHSIINSNFANNGNTRGTLTGFHFLDEKGGLQPSDLIVIAGDTSQGKTAFANAIVVNALLNDKKVVFYSMEMAHIQISARMVAMQSGISSFKILNEKLSEEEVLKSDKAIGKLEQFNKSLFVNDKDSSSIDSIISFIRTMKRKHDIDGAVVDYLQILSVNSKAPTEEKNMADAARRLKNLAKELDIWIIAISQLSRGDSNNPEPNINRLRSSGQIAEAADMVMLVYRPEVYGKDFSFPKPFEKCDIKGKSMINLCKGRNTGTGKFICGFHAETTHFYQLDETEFEKKSEAIQMPW